MSRFTRRRPKSARNRKRYSRARRNTSGLTVIPFNPLGIAWAAAYYDLQVQYQNYLAAVEQLFGVTEFDEEALAEKLDAIKVGSKTEQAKLVNWLKEHLGLKEEMEAALPKPNFGILDTMPERTIRDLARETSVSTEKGLHFAFAPVGSNTILWPVGSFESKTGTDLAPLVSSRLGLNNLESLVVAMIAQGLLDSKTEKWKGPLHFDVPPGDVGYNFSKAVCKTVSTYLGEDQNNSYRLAVSVSTFAGLLKATLTVGDSTPIALSGKRAPGGEGYDLKSADGKLNGRFGYTDDTGEQANLRLKGQKPFLPLTLQLDSRERVCPKEGFIAYLNKAALSLLDKASRGDTRIVKKVLGLGENKDTDRVSFALIKQLITTFIKALPELKVEVTEAKTEDSWFGNPPTLRAFVSNRLGRRAAGSGRHKGFVPTLFSLARRGENVSWVNNLRENYTIENLLAISDGVEDENKAEGVRARVEQKLYRPSAPKVDRNYPLDPTSPLLQMGVAVYALLDEAALAIMRKRGSSDAAYQEYEKTSRKETLQGPVYGLFYHKMFTAREVLGTIVAVRRAVPGKDENFSEYGAFLFWLGKASGLSSLLAQRQKKKDVIDVVTGKKKKSKKQYFPPCTVTTTFSSDAELIQEYPFSPGIQVSPEIAVNLGELVIPKDEEGSQFIDPKIVYTKGLTALEVARVTRVDILPFSSTLNKVIYAKDQHKLVPVAGNAAWGTPNVFASRYIKGLPYFATLMQILRAVPETNRLLREQGKKAPDDLSDPEMEVKAYTTMLSGVARRFVGAGADQFVGGQRAKSAWGGSNAMGVMRGRSPDPKNLYWATKGRMVLLTVYNFVARICAATTACATAGSRRTQIAALTRPEMNLIAPSVLFSGVKKPKKRLAQIMNGDVTPLIVPSEALPDVDLKQTYHTQIGNKLFRLKLKATKKGYQVKLVPLEIESGQDLIWRKMVQYGIELPDFNDNADKIRALTALRDAVKSDYRLRATRGLLQAEDASNPFPNEYLAELSKPNPRRGARRPRRARRYSRARKNPFTEEELRDVQNYATLGTEEEAAKKAFSSLRERRPPDTWPVDAEKVGNLFPRTKPAGEKQRWHIDKRLQTLGPKGTDFISRLALPRVDEDKLLSISSSALPFESADGRDVITQYSELTLDDAKKVLSTQAKKYKEPRKTLPASSALCKVYRAQKLKYYPSYLEKLPRRNVVILASPPGYSSVRVMTFKMGSHVDCDMVGTREQDLPKLIGRAVQASLYWIAENPVRRAKNMRIWVARVGQPEMYLAWQSTDPLTLEQVNDNLGRGVNGEEGFTHKLFRPSEARSEKEIRNYKSLASKLKPMPKAAALSSMADLEEVLPPVDKPRPLQKTKPVSPDIDWLGEDEGTPVTESLDDIFGSSD